MRSNKEIKFLRQLVFLRRKSLKKARAEMIKLRAKARKRKEEIARTIKNVAAQNQRRIAESKIVSQYEAENIEWPRKDQRKRMVMVKTEFINSLADGECAFSWLISPISSKDFFRKAWEKGPVYVNRTEFPEYYREIVTTQKLNQVLRNNFVLFSKNIDVTSYVNGIRKTHNPSGRATPAVVWDFYKKGCSIRMLNPQAFFPELLKLNATLQEFFGCSVGASGYLTPPGARGFAPHYDDIEAFVLQLEGRSHWKLYSPRNEKEVLSRRSSENLSQKELGYPVLEVTLNPGDLLYFPRGFIHQASTDPEQHSLHITLSCYQNNTWGDFLEKLLPAAVAQAMEENVMFRKGMPIGYLSHIGISRAHPSEPRQHFNERVLRFMEDIIKMLPIGAVADQMCKKFIHKALPPVLSANEEQYSIFSRDNIYITGKATVKGSISLTLNTRVKLLRAHILRLVKDDPESNKVHVYHYADNSLQSGEELQSFQVSANQALALSYLITKYPALVLVSKIPLKRKMARLKLANLLWKKGLLVTDKLLDEYREEMKIIKKKKEEKKKRKEEEGEKKKRKEEKKKKRKEEKKKRKEEGGGEGRRR